MKEEDQVSKAMSSLDDIKRAKAPQDTFAKIQQKLAYQRMTQTPVELQSSKAWMRVAAVIALVVCSNIWAVSNYLASDSMPAVASDSYARIMTDFNLYENE